MFYHAELKHLREWQAYTAQFRCLCVRVCLSVCILPQECVAEGCFLRSRGQGELFSTDIEKREPDIRPYLNNPQILEGILTKAQD